MVVGFLCGGLVVVGDLYFLYSAEIVGFVGCALFHRAVGRDRTCAMGSWTSRPSTTVNSNQARDVNLPVAVAIFTTSPSDRYSGTCITNPVDTVAGLVLLVALAPLMAGSV